MTSLKSCDIIKVKAGGNKAPCERGVKSMKSSELTKVKPELEIRVVEDWMDIQYTAVKEFFEDDQACFNSELDSGKGDRGWRFTSIEQMWKVLGGNMDSLMELLAKYDLGVEEIKEGAVDYPILELEDVINGTTSRYGVAVTYYDPVSTDPATLQYADTLNEFYDEVQAALELLYDNYLERLTERVQEVYKTYTDYFTIIDNLNKQ